MDKEPNTITVGRLRRELAIYSDDDELFFGGGDLTYVRAKPRNAGTPILVQIEFGELYHVEPYE